MLVVVVVVVLAVGEGRWAVGGGRWEVLVLVGGDDGWRYEHSYKGLAVRVCDYMCASEVGEKRVKMVAARVSE